MASSVTRLDQLCDGRSEALLELIARGGGLLPCVVEQSRGDHRVRLSGVIEQLGHCQGMGDERYVIAIAQLPLVACGGKPKRCLR